MRSSTPRTSASLVLLLASTVLGPGALAQAQRPDGSAPSAPQTTAPAAPSAATPTPAAPAPAAKPAAPVPATKPVAPAATKTPGTAATVAPMKTIEGVLSKAVRSRSGNEDMGHIVDVLVDGSGELRAAVIDFGGFLGVGSRKVAVAWKALDFADSIASGSVKIALTRDQIRQAPEYKPDEPIVILEGNAQPKPEAPAPAKRETAPPAKPAPAAPPPGHNEDSPPR